MNAPVRPRVSSHYNNTTVPKIPTTAAAMATPAGFSAPLLGETDTGRVADFVGDAGALTKTVLFGDGVGAVALPDTWDAVALAKAVVKPELVVAVCVGVDTAAVSAV